MKITNRKLPPRRCEMTKWNRIARELKFGQCLEPVSDHEAKSFLRACKRMGFSGTQRKINGVGIAVWKLRKKAK